MYSQPELTTSIAKKVGVKVGKVSLDKFANNETTVREKKWDLLKKQIVRLVLGAA